MSKTTQKLEALCKSQPKFLRKGGLCVALVVTQAAREKGLPLDPENLRTDEGGQVAGLGKAAVQKILEAHQIKKVLAEEGGRTSRGSLGLMKAYIEALNDLHDDGALDLDSALAWWIQKVRAHFASEGPKFQFDPDSAEALVRKCGDNLKGGLKPVIISIRQPVSNCSAIGHMVTSTSGVNGWATRSVLRALRFLRGKIIPLRLIPGCYRCYKKAQLLHPCCTLSR